MGVVANVSATQYPKQSDRIGTTASICFNYDTSVQFDGIIIRDDMESPGELLFLLSDGRVIRSVECMYQLPATNAVTNPVTFVPFGLDAKPNH